jgi:hypothetical protein
MNEPALKLNDSLEISLVLPGQVSIMWKECEKILQKSCKRSNGRISPMDIYYRCIENRSSLWIIFESETMEIVGCAVTQLHDYPTKLRMLNIEHVAGKRYEDWVEDGFKTLYKWAIDNKCDGIEALGRAGFWR